MAVSDGVMTALRITDPRTWITSTVIHDALPHLTYGAVTALTLHRMAAPSTVQIS